MQVWRLAAVRSVSSDGKTLFIVADDGASPAATPHPACRCSSDMRSPATDTNTRLPAPCGGSPEETVYTVGKDRSHPFDPSHAIDMDDLAFLNNMHEAPLLHVLKR